MKDKALIWDRHIKRQDKSSLTILSYCERHDLSPGMFYYWKRKLSHASVSPQASFHEIDIQPHGERELVIEVHLGQGKMIRIEGDVSPSFLRELIQC